MPRLDLVHFRSYSILAHFTSLILRKFMVDLSFFDNDCTTGFRAFLALISDDDIVMLSA